MNRSQKETRSQREKEREWERKRKLFAWKFIAKNLFGVSSLRLHIIKVIYRKIGCHCFFRFCILCLTQFSHLNSSLPPILSYVPLVGCHHTLLRFFSLVLLSLPLNKWLLLLLQKRPNSRSVQCNVTTSSKCSGILFKLRFTFIVVARWLVCYFLFVVHVKVVILVHLQLCYCERVSI